MKKAAAAARYTYDIQKRQIQANSDQDVLEAITSLELTKSDNFKSIVYVLAICVAAIIIVINI